MAYKATDEKVDLETGFNRSRSPVASQVPFVGHESWRTKETLHGTRAPLDRHSTIWIPAWGGSVNQPAQPQEPQFRKFGDPAPLGLCASALTLFILSLLNLNSGGVSEPSIVVGAAYAYGGLVQLLSGMWEYALGETLAATALSSCGGFWLSFALIETRGLGIQAAYTTQADLNNAIGFFLIAWFIFGVLCTLCTLKSSLAFFSLFFFLDITFLLLSIAHFHQGPDGSVHQGLTRLGGGFGIACSISCWWNAMAGLLDESNSFFTLPVFPFPWSKEAQEKKA